MKNTYQVVADGSRIVHTGTVKREAEKVFNAYKKDNQSVFLSMNSDVIKSSEPENKKEVVVAEEPKEERKNPQHIIIKQIGGTISVAPVPVKRLSKHMPPAKIVRIILQANNNSVSNCFQTLPRGLYPLAFPDVEEMHGKTIKLFRNPAGNFFVVNLKGI